MSVISHHHGSRTPRRVRNEVRFRRITVSGKSKVADNFWRIEFSHADLAGFTSPGFDDHIKVFFPDEPGTELPLPQMTEQGVVWEGGVRPQSRDYTPLFFDSEKQTLTLDFYIHNAGVASDWAQRAQIGDVLTIGGPRGSLLVPEDYALQIYICDETSLPAFKRRKEALHGQQCRLFAFVDHASGSAYLDDMHGVEASWLGSGNMRADHLAALTSSLDTIPLPEGDYFIWLTGEGDAVKKLSEYFIERRGCDSQLVRAVAYWHQK